MKIYSHRGNLEGPDPEWENHPSKFEQAFREKFYVMADVTGKDGALYGGSVHLISFDFVQQHKYQMIFRATNFEAIKLLRQRDVHYFYLDSDAYSLTSWNWSIMNSHDENPYDFLTIMLNPEKNKFYDPEYLPDIGGVITNYPKNWTNR